MARDIGTGGCAVLADICVVQGVGEIPPLEGMNRLRVAEMTLGAGDVRSRAGQIVPVTDGTRRYIGLRVGGVAAWQPSGRVGRNYRRRRGGGRDLILRTSPPAPGQQEEAKQKQQERLQRSFSYL